MKVLKSSLNSDCKGRFKVWECSGLGFSSAMGSEGWHWNRLFFKSAVPTGSVRCDVQALDYLTSAHGALSARSHPSYSSGFEWYLQK